MSRTSTPDADEWRRIEALYSAAEPLASIERVAFLEAHCGDDEGVRRIVEGLLAAGDVEHDLLADAIGRAAASVAGEPIGTAERSTESPSTVSRRGGDRLGAYHLLRVLGRGGMGTVYLAERVDGEFDQRVAVKLMREGLFGGEARRRFLMERQILARLDHPAVAQLLDGGTTEDGRPYLVMEYIDGQPIDRYCDEHRLSIDQRLALFRRVCEAVHDAHGKLIVHRDLKPLNILVTTAGRPKLLDFGISKLLDAEGPGAAATQITLGGQMLTPEYASPEQLRDEPVTTAVDVHALGLLLHRLLTGTHAYSGPPSSPEQWRRAICDVEAERPSASIGRLSGSKGRGGEVSPEALAVAANRSSAPGRLRRRLAGDLDHIVAKALRKEPSGRYPSVERLSADVGRHLEGLPVEARQGGWRYRTGRFMRRHRTGTFAIVAVVLALLLGLVGLSREATRASREALASAKVIEFLTDLFEASDPYKTLETTTVSDLLHRAVERVPDALEAEPLVQARLMASLGGVYHNRGHFEQAQPLFEGVLSNRRATLPDDDALIATAHLNLADNLRVLDRVDEALPHYSRALAIRGRRFGAESIEAAEVMNNLALARMDNAEQVEAEALLQTALEIRRKVLGADFRVAQTSHNLALLSYRLGAYARSVTLARETLELKHTLLPPRHPSTGRTMVSLSRSLVALDNDAEAERVLSEGVEILEDAWGDEHLDVLAAGGDLAELRHRLGDVEAAEAAQRQILRAKEEHLGVEHLEVAFSLVSLARQVRDQARFDESAHLLIRALEIREGALDPGHPSIARTRLEQARTFAAAGRDGACRDAAGAALRTLEQALPVDHPRLGEARKTLESCRSRHESTGSTVAD